MKAKEGALGRAPFISVNTSVTMPSFFFGFVFASVASMLLWLNFVELTWEILIIVSFSAAFASADFIDVLRQRRDVFSPRSLVSLLMIGSVYLAPIVHVSLEAYPKNVDLPGDMVEALTSVAVLQLFGHALYYFVLRMPLGRPKAGTFYQTQSVSERIGNFSNLSHWMTTLAVFSFVLFVYTVMQAGGPQSWLDVQLERRAGEIVSGAVLSLAEAFPILLFVAYALRLKGSSLSRKELSRRLIIAFVLLVAVTFLVSGLRGSRANLVWPSLSGLVIIHVVLFRIRLKTVAVIALVGVAFAGVYDIYKKAGTEGLDQFRSGSLEAIDDYAGYGFGPVQLLLGDFSRTGVQAILLDRWNNDLYEPYAGVTYIGDAMAFVPGAEPLEAMPSKTVAGTEVLYGEGASVTRPKLSTRIYGLQGEALINFGPLGSVLIFIPCALFIRWIEHAYARAKSGISLRSSILIPLLLPAAALLYLSDFDNVLNNLTSLFVLPLLAVVLAAVTMPNRKRFLRRKKHEVNIN